MELGELWTELGYELEATLGAYRERLEALDVVEKSDHALLTEADLAIQAVIVEKICRFDPGAKIIAEESVHD